MQSLKYGQDGEINVFLQLVSFCIFIFAFQSFKKTLFFFSGITAFALAMILGITSLPSVTNVLTWKEFAFVQSKLGWLCLCLGIAHDLFNGWGALLGVKCNFFLHGGNVRNHKIMFVA